VKQLEQQKLGCAIRPKQGCAKSLLKLPVAVCVTSGRSEMTYQRRAGLHLLLSIVAALGCSASVLSGTVAAIHHSASTAIVDRAHA
jgi:hypothetical protein